MLLKAHPVLSLSLVLSVALSSLAAHAKIESQKIMQVRMTPLKGAQKNFTNTINPKVTDSKGNEARKPYTKKPTILIYELFVDYDTSTGDMVQLRTFGWKIAPGGYTIKVADIEKGAAFDPKENPNLFVIKGSDIKDGGEVSLIYADATGKDHSANAKVAPSTVGLELKQDKKRQDNGSFKSTWSVTLNKKPINYGTLTINSGNAGEVADDQVDDSEGFVVRSAAFNTLKSDAELSAELKKYQTEKACLEADKPKTGKPEWRAIQTQADLDKYLAKYPCLVKGEN